MEFSSSVEMFLITRNPLEGTKRNFIMKRNRNREAERVFRMPQTHVAALLPNSNVAKFFECANQIFA